MNGKKGLLLAIIALMVGAIAGVGFYYWHQGNYYVSTEDAKVAGDIFKVNPQITGKLIEFSVGEGDRVVKDQIIGRQEMLSQPSGAVETSVLRSPIDGIIIKKQANVGEIVSPGQTLAMVVNPEEIYITANIEENKLQRIHPGQPVDITIDQFGSRKFSGQVDSIGQAANSAFSLLPTSTSGNFTKVIQKVSVKIVLDNIEEQLLPATNAAVRIHLR